MPGPSSPAALTGAADSLPLAGAVLSFINALVSEYTQLKSAVLTAFEHPQPPYAKRKGQSFAAFESNTTQSCQCNAKDRFAIALLQCLKQHG